MNKQSNTYTILYAAIMVIVVAILLSLTSQVLKPLQQENIRADKMQQILYAANVSAGDDVKATFERYITDIYAVDEDGNVVEEDNDNAFNIDMKKSLKAEGADRVFPVFEFTGDDGAKRYILALSGAGLWGDIWGYVAIEADGSTIYGAYFSHAGETPGLGAEIEKPIFQEPFKGKSLVKDGEFKPIQVMKKGQTPTDGSDYVDAISGGTITSKGVQNMIHTCLSGYKAFLQNIDNQTTNQE